MNKSSTLHVNQVLGVVVSACLCLLVGWSTGLVHLAATSLIIQWLAFIPGKSIYVYMDVYYMQVYHMYTYYIYIYNIYD